MQKPIGQTEFKYLAFMCLVGTVLLFAPATVIESVKSLFLDAAVPGQELTIQLVEQSKTALKQFEPTGKHIEDVTRLQQEIETWQETVRKLQSQNLTLLQTVNTIEQRAIPHQSGSEQRLFETNLIEARVLGEESSQLWRSGKLLNRGDKHKVQESAMVLDSPHALLDLGADFNLHTGQTVFAGRCVVGKISRVGNWSSTLLPISDVRYHGGLVQLVRFTDSGPVVVASGKIQGAGNQQCRITAVEATAAIQPGDAVYTQATDELISTPMYFGKVTQAKLASGAPEWDILLDAALDIKTVNRVQILNRTLNPSRVLAN